MLFLIASEFDIQISVCYGFNVCVEKGSCFLLASTEAYVEN